MKRALASALTILGLTLAGHSPASAAAGGLPGITAPLGDTVANTLTPAGGCDGWSGCCLWDWPIIGAGVAFAELARDEEIDFHCCSQRYGTYTPSENAYGPVPSTDDRRSYTPRRSYRSW